MRLGNPLNAIFGFKGIAVTAGIALVLGTGAGWKAKSTVEAAQANKAKDRQITALEKAIEDEKTLRLQADSRASDLELAIEAREEHIEELIDATIDMASSRGRDTVRIIEKGEEVANALPDSFAWVRNSWPPSLLAYANGDGGEGGLPVAPALPTVTEGLEGAPPPGSGY